MIRTCLLVVVLGMMVGCEFQPRGSKDERAAPGRPPAPVEAVVVERTTLAREVVASGVASGIREAYVVSQTQGTIKKVAFTLGARVRKGQLLVRVQNALQGMSLEQSKKSVATAAINLRAVQKLYDQGNASEAELTQAQSQATGAEAGLEQAQEAYNNTLISAPISGYIAQKELTITEGNVLTGGTLVTRVVDISSLKTILSVGETELGLLGKGQAAQVRVPAAGSETFTGKVAAIGAGADAATGSYPVEVIWRNTADRRIKSGMTVRVRIETDSPDSVTLVPSVAITEIDRKDAVWVATAGKSAARFVELGRSVGNVIEIARGLNVGDTVVTSGVSALNRGDSLLTTVIASTGGTQ